MTRLRANTIPDPIRFEDFRALLGLDDCDHVCSRAAIGDGERYTDRACSPGDTFSRVSPLFRRYGVTRVARQTGLDRVGIPVWSAIRPNSLSLAINQGKGIGDADARISAVMEALERAVAGEPEIISRIATPAQMRSDNLAIDTLDGLVGKGHHPAGDHDVIAWAEGHDLIARRAVWVPLHAVILDRTVETRFWQSSDGLASGNTPLEATFHGLMERIERDAETLWSFARSKERAERCVDPALLEDSVVDRLVENIRGAGLALQVFDMTSDIGVACFQALIGPRDMTRRQDVLYAEAANGSGCHPDPVRAVIRAITEAAQSRLTLVSGSRDDIPAATYARPLPKELIEDFGFKPVIGDRPRPQPDLRPLPAKLRSTIEALKARAITSIVAVPLNPLDADFSVVKVLVPELENPPGARRRRFGMRAMARIARPG